MWKRNLRLFVAYRAGTSLLVYMAISLPFYQNLGFDLTHIGWLYAINTGTVLLLDIPTGYIADRFSYRGMMFAGVAIQAVGYGLLAACSVQWPVYLLQFVLGLGTAVARGADGPLARKSAEKSGANFGKYSRAAVAAMGVAEGSASLITAAIAWGWPGQAPRLAMGLQTLVYVCVLYIPWRMHEERPASNDSLATVVRQTKHHLANLAATLHSELQTNHEAAWLLLYGATIGCTTQTVVALVQPYFQQLHLANWQFALLWASYHFLWAVFSLISGWYERLLSRWQALASLVVWGIVTNAAMAVFGGTSGLFVMIAFYFIRGVQMPIVLDYMTGVVGESRRATLLAAQSSVQFGMCAVMNAILGYATDHHGVRCAFGISLVVYGILGVVFIMQLKKAAK